jgi:hypothetical protein
MPEKVVPRILDETSVSVQTHLGILQGVIERMAANSTSAKAWCITIVSAILVVVADKGKPDLVYLAVIPTVLFLSLDLYYLGLEKGFRNAYGAFVTRLHAGTLTPDDLFSVSPVGGQSRLQLESFKSFSVWGFYFVLVVMIVVARYVVLN